MLAFADVSITVRNVRPAPSTGNRGKNTTQKSTKMKRNRGTRRATENTAVSVLCPLSSDP
jgi:hypothetical protein